MKQMLQFLTGPKADSLVWELCCCKQSKTDGQASGICHSLSELHEKTFSLIEWE